MLNILNGDSAAVAFKQAFLTNKKNLLIFRDVLSCGLLKNFSDTQTWMNDRNKYWNTILNEQSSNELFFHDAPRDFYINISELQSVDEIKLWIGSALSDHLLLVFLVFLLNHLKISFDKLSIIQFTHFTNRSSLVRGLGVLNPDQIKQHPPPFKLNKAQNQECLNVWKALTNPCPDEYMSLIHIKSLQITTLQQPLKAFLYRYPKISNGLSFWDEMILKNIKSNWSNAARVIGSVMTESYQTDLPIALDTVGDVYLFHRLKNLANPSLNEPLIQINTIDAPLRNTEVEILDFGREALDEKHNVVTVNGINDWVGGVHLHSSSGGTWFRNNNQLNYVELDTYEDNH